MEAGAGPLLDLRSALASVAFRGALLARGWTGLWPRRCRNSTRTMPRCIRTYTRMTIPRRASGTSRNAGDERGTAAWASGRGRRAEDAAQGGGEITLAQMLHKWALHESGHIRQIAELVRAWKYLAGAGPLALEAGARTGCCQEQQFPSGWRVTASGPAETRLSYLGSNDSRAAAQL